jgi:hypothetical protein
MPTSASLAAIDLERVAGLDHDPPMDVEVQQR